MAAVTFAQLVGARQALLLGRMAALEELREAGETTRFDPEYDRLCEELQFVVALVHERLSLHGVRAGS